MAQQHKLNINIPDLENPTTPQYLAWRAVNHAQAASIPGYTFLPSQSLSLLLRSRPPADVVHANNAMTTAPTKLFADTYAALKGETLLHISQAQSLFQGPSVILILILRKIVQSLKKLFLTSLLRKLIRR